MGSASKTPCGVIAALSDPAGCQRFGSSLSSRFGERERCWYVHKFENEEREWAAEKRTFVADDRDEVADERDRMAGVRDGIAEDREGDLDAWERRLDARDTELSGGVGDPGASEHRAAARVDRSLGGWDRDQAKAERKIAAAVRSDAQRGGKPTLRQRGWRWRSLKSRSSFMTPTTLTVSSLESPKSQCQLSSDAKWRASSPGPERVPNGGVDRPLGEGGG